ncbi:AimR family lysis-lysogeny pheromone receptor [Aquibacillus koreensis]|uniref:AimR family lysis-lysogeny pheromone receptor n=1 Tax=Aquibacillus koreensis TaxID=279446 RepID=A0A9X3WHB3_9BACI|nr:AimR family lysis-lysogeny pheromone receptor [Aquibacillus koreensis]MCT2535104.1 AimR family lysis-lysogeny pheromone receptor [Aquibacillus koreensis]MDC3419747.1 AimR family lysis-lysogeny pheromone receptor [Aquibacillus koreensis]
MVPKPFYEDSNLVDSYNKMQTTLNLHQFITMVSLDNDEKTVIQLAKQFLLESNSESDWRVGMEFLYMNGLYKELELLIDRNKQAINPINIKFGIIYDLMLARIRGEIPVHQLFEQIESIESDMPDVQCLKHFMTIAINFSSHRYDSLGYYLDNIKCLLLQIENPLLVSLFKTRLNILLFIYYWKRNELILARKHAYRALNQTLNIERKAQLHINLGLSYIYDDYASSIHHLQEALKIGEAYDNKRILRSIKDRNYPFVCAHFGVTEEVQTNDPSEKAHLEIVKGNLAGARVILENLEPTPFRKYYMGLATGERKYFINAYNDFIEKRSDHFFARLPLHHIKK